MKPTRKGASGPHPKSSTLLATSAHTLFFHMGISFRLFNLETAA